MDISAKEEEEKIVEIKHKLARIQTTSTYVTELRQKIGLYLGDVA